MLHDKDLKLSLMQQQHDSLLTEQQETKEKCEFYKAKFMDEARELLRARDCFRQVVEDSKTHVQYIQVLEKRIRELET